MPKFIKFQEKKKKKMETLVGMAAQKLQSTVKWISERPEGALPIMSLRRKKWGCVFWDWKSSKRAHVFIIGFNKN